MVALWAIVLLAAYLQRQAGLSTVGEAHLLAVDWLGWICYLFDKLGLFVAGNFFGGDGYYIFAKRADYIFSPKEPIIFIKNIIVW